MIIQILLASFISFGAGPLSTIEKKCRQTYKKDSESLCFCVTTNLKTKLHAAQLAILAKTYTDRNARLLASKSQSQKHLLDLDYQVHSECSKDSAWRIPPEDMGEPNSLDE